MSAENKGYQLIEFEHCVKAPDQESSKRTVFLHIFEHNLESIALNGMMLIEQGNEIVKPQIGLFFMGLGEFLIYFVYYAFVNHYKGYSKMIFFLYD